MKLKIKMNKYRLVLFILFSLTIIPLSTQTSAKLTDDQIIDFKGLSFTANTVTVEFDKSVTSYPTTKSNFYIILLYESSSSWNGIYVLSISTQELEAFSYSIATTIEKSFSWIDGDFSSIELSGSVVFVDYLDYNIIKGEPTNIKALGILSTDKFNEFIGNIQNTIMIYESFFKLSDKAGGLYYTTNRSTTANSDTLSPIPGFEAIIGLLSICASSLYIKNRKK